jgi:hypothetical protein
MTAAKKVVNTPKAWEEGLLGRDEEHVAVAGAEHEAALDEALGMQAISIRLPRQLVDHYKLIAHFHGVGYQPLMRDVLARFVPAALKEVLEAEQAKAVKASEQAALPRSKKRAA